MDSRLRERLGSLARRRRADATPPEEGTAAIQAPALFPEPGTPASGRKGGPLLDRILPGQEVRLPSGLCWRHTRPLSGWPGADPLLPGRLALLLGQAPPTDLALDPALELWRSLGFGGGVFLDLETTGLSATPVFLAGLITLSGEGPLFHLLFARNYGEEKPLIELIARELEAHPVAITYNGKSYDLPFLRERIGRLRVAGARPPAVLDLLHPARRRWRGRFPDCRLTTLESALCGKRRGPDVNGRDIPDLYHRYVRDQDPRPLLRVFSHNMEDLATLMRLAELILVSEPEPKPGRPLEPARRPRRGPDAPKSGDGMRGLLKF